MLAKSFLKILSLCICVILLSQCTKIAENQAQARRSNQQASTPYTMPASAYLALAKNQSGEAQQNLMLMAAGRQIYDGQWREGLDNLSQMGDDLPYVQAAEKAILLAKIDVTRQQARAAIAKLSMVRDLSSLPDFYQVQYHDILASAYESVGNTTESVHERIKLERIIPNEEERLANSKMLWLTLTKLPIEELNTLAVEAKDGSDVQGWMKLALIAREHQGSMSSNLGQVEEWRQQYPNHPANVILPPSLSEVKPSLTHRPRQMALLLPLTGPLAGPGEAVRDGFMAAANAEGNSTGIRLYDTAKGNVTELYQQALAEGADYIVGPLSKPDVAAIADMNHPVPTLLLNDIETNLSNNAYRFGLSPVNEAKQVALKAGKNGHRRALVIAPAGAWGEEIANGFGAQWQTMGGVIVDKLSYANNSDLNLAIKSLLKVTDSQEREKKIKQLLGHRVQVAQTRRQDFDMIFLLAYPSKARQIMPLLKYYYAGDIPVYATSSVYSGSVNAMKDKDLDGIIFCDMPFVFKHQMGSRNWPEQLNSYNRLYALGMDSFALANQLNQLQVFPTMGIHDKSGVLYLNQAQQVARVPAWAQFKQGVAVQMTEST
ncbi:penicillin-binding protein activator [Legionella jordanis]|uniref:penicillin-binding protein activator n=1 Tax=Legionella jordanis TaxID=456 RepID=UPI000F00F52B|nr:penicillin-binding protein activator [Legionella jordanis]RMX21744.1 penicillin-binding protein activator [Legionella jordanis]